jgi:hypothetical protein
MGSIGEYSDKFAVFLTRTDTKKGQKLHSCPFSGLNIKVLNEMIQEYDVSVQCRFLAVFYFEDGSDFGLRNAPEVDQ